MFKTRLFVTITLSTALAACGVTPTAECVDLDTSAADYEAQAAGCKAQASEIGWEPACGNGYMESGESCDASHFQIKGCTDIPRFGEYAGGNLACSAQCTIDTSGCMENFTYPAGPYGASEGLVTDMMTFVPANQAAKDMAGNDEVFDLTHIYLNGTAHGGTINTVLLFETAGWCPYCKDEAEYLNALYNELKDQGLLIVGVISQDNSGTPATTEYANGYAEQYRWDFPTVAGDIHNSYRGGGGLPNNLTLSVGNMNYYDQFNGAMEEWRMRMYLTGAVNEAANQ